MNIPISKPYFGEEEKKAILEPLDTGWVVQGPKVAEFEKLFASFTGTPHAIAVTSCTTALQLAMVAMNVQPGDEVILPAFTWVATANVVEMQGAKPVFVDIDLETFNIAPESIEDAITDKTKAIIPVSLFGVSAPMREIMDIAQRHHLTVVEDDACATGAGYQDKHAGILADIACFSFHPRKAITTGEGGMIITAKDEVAEVVRSLRDHGASVNDLTRHHGSRSYLLPEFNMVGYNYRMTDFQGAVGVIQMGRLEWILGERARIARRYDEALNEFSWLRTPITPSDRQHGYQAYVCLFQPEAPSIQNVKKLNQARNALMDKLEAKGIATRPGTHAVHMLGYYRRKYGIQPEDFPNAYIADQLSLTLPLYVQLSEQEQDYVISNLAELVTTFKV